MSKIFGGSKSQSTSTTSNRAYDDISQAYSPMMGMAGTGANALQALLSGDASGFNAYKGATGFDAMAEEGSRGITGNAAASGLLRSGSTGKALQGYGQNLQNQFAGNYMDRLLGMSGLGLQAGGLISQAGQTGESTSTSKNKPGLGGMIGQIGAGIAASDRRLKTNVRKIGKLRNGLGLYTYDYINGSGPFVGVMADEVREIMPEALGPVIGGYDTVDYDKIKEVA